MILAPTGISSPASRSGYPWPSQRSCSWRTMRATLPRPGIALQDSLPDHRVLAHHLPFALVELGALVEDLVGDGHLADVVQERRRLDALGLAFVDPQPARDLRGQLDDRVRVIARVAVALRERLRKPGDRIRDRFASRRPVGGGLAGFGDAPSTRGPGALHGFHGRERERLGAQRPDPLGDPDRDGHALNRADAGGLQLQQHALEGEVGGARPGLRKDHEKLVRAGPADEVAHSGRLLQDAADRAKQIVGHLAPVACVDLMETVDVDDSHRQWPAVPASTLDLGLEAALEGLLARKSRERVALGSARQFGFDLGESPVGRRQLLLELFDLTLGPHRREFSARARYASNRGHVRWTTCRAAAACRTRSPRTAR